MAVVESGIQHQTLVLVLVVVQAGIERMSLGKHQEAAPAQKEHFHSQQARIQLPWAAVVREELQHQHQPQPPQGLEHRAYSVQLHQLAVAQPVVTIQHHQQHHQVHQAVQVAAARTALEDHRRAPVQEQQIRATPEALWLPHLRQMLQATEQAAVAVLEELVGQELDRHRAGLGVLAFRQTLQVPL